MRSETFHADGLIRLLRGRKIVTMPELKETLGTQVDVTVFRKLKELGYRTSYSHRGSFYTLDDIARFDDSGLWSYQSVWFSRYGTLVKTAEAFVVRSQAGYFTEELDNALHVGTKDTLRKLFRERRVTREEVSGRYLYCSTDPVIQQQQAMVRRLQESEPRLSRSLMAAESVPDELRAAMVLYVSLLDEKQRRLYAGLESLKLGHRGDQRVAEFLGMDPHTVARGRQQLLAQDFEVQRVRKAGAGRKPVEKKLPK
jgi:hypothetical protein